MIARHEHRKSKKFPLGQVIIFNPMILTNRRTFQTREKPARNKKWRQSKAVKLKKIFLLFDASKKRKVCQ
jgi:hypothetical protein